jgi:hypothetical protein
VLEIGEDNVKLLVGRKSPADTASPVGLSKSVDSQRQLHWVQHFIHHLAPDRTAGFVLVRVWFLVKLKAARVFKSLDSSTPVSFRERRSETRKRRRDFFNHRCHALNQLSRVR